MSTKPKIIDKYSFTYDYSLYKYATVSGGSRKSYSYKSSLPYQFRHKIFMYTNKGHAGVSKGIVCRTKGKVSVKYNILRSTTYRSLHLSFIGGFFLIPFKLKLFSFILFSSGSVMYVNSTTNHVLFTISLLKSYLKVNRDTPYRSFSNGGLYQMYYLLYQLPKYKNISLLEISPSKGTQYVKSPGTKAFLSKKNPKLSYVLVKLPSGVHKTFSSYSTGSIGNVPLSLKNLTFKSSAGYFKKTGHKSLSRGIAKNPVDHPHGGRAKAIRYQRTP